MDSRGAANISRPPKWVMCMVCGDVIYGGPGFHPIPRECTCKATRVVPREDRGYVQWDKEKYYEGARENVMAAITKAIQREAIEAASKLEKLGAPEEDIKTAYKNAREEAEKRLLSTVDEEIRKAPMEPEIEYVNEGERLEARIPVAPPTTISDIYKRHWEQVERGMEP